MSLDVTELKLMKGGPASISAAIFFVFIQKSSDTQSVCMMVVSLLNWFVCDFVNPQLYLKGLCVILFTMHICVSMGIFFSVTVVAKYNKFWVKLPGPIINQHGVTPLPTQSDTTPPPVQSTTPSILPGPVSIWLNPNVFPGKSASAESCPDSSRPQADLGQTSSLFV